MDYFISRDGQKYGPYTLADLQRYVASGEVSLTDLATSDALTEPVPVAQVVGNIAATAPPTNAAPLSMASMYPDPPNLHWGLVLLFCVITCGIFTLVWEIVQAVWVKRVAPQSKSIVYFCVAGAALVGIFITSFLKALHASGPDLTSLVQIGLLRDVSRSAFQPEE